jgi:Inositolphosphorylceramide synthase subunit Kei1
VKLVIYSYFFLIDFVVNVLYTILFASIWFFTIPDSENATPLGGNSVKEAAPPPPMATTTPNPLTGQHANPIAATGITDQGGPGQTLGVISITFFWFVKLYMVFIIFSYARSIVVRNHITPSSLSLPLNYWGQVQRWMLAGDYWRETDEDYKQDQRRIVTQ